jgi:hypothetical protein
MGCNDREEPTVEELEYEKRKKRVIADIHALPLSRLTVVDSLSLHDAFFHRHFGIGRGDIEMMEEILERVGE